MMMSYNLKKLAVLVCTLCTTIVFIQADMDSMASKASEKKEKQTSVKTLVRSIYKNSFDNFEKVINFALTPEKPEFTADVLIALYAVMRKAKHTDSPLQAVALYNEIKKHLATDLSNVDKETVTKLEGLLDSLIWKNIVPKSSTILEAAVYLENCNTNGTMVGNVQDNLKKSDESLTDATYKNLVESVRSVMRPKDLIRILSKISSYTEQNVAALLALHNGTDISENLLIDFLGQLVLLMKKSDYNKTVSVEKQQAVANLFPNAYKALLLEKYICLNQRSRDGAMLFLGSCGSNDSQLCVQKTSTLLSPELITQNTTGLAFAFKIYNGSYMSLRPGISEMANGVRLNVFDAGNVASDYFWKIQAKMESLILTNLNETMYLCAGSSVSAEQNAVYAYTRSLSGYQNHQKECWWNLRCKHRKSGI